MAVENANHMITTKSSPAPGGDGVSPGAPAPGETQQAYIDAFNAVNSGKVTDRRAYATSLGLNPDTLQKYINYKYGVGSDPTVNLGKGTTDGGNGENTDGKADNGGGGAPGTTPTPPTTTPATPTATPTVNQTEAPSANNAAAKAAAAEKTYTTYAGLPTGYSSNTVQNDAIPESAPQFEGNVATRGAGGYNVYDGAQNWIGYFDSAGNWHANGASDEVTDAWRDAALARLQSQGVTFNGDGTDKVNVGESDKDTVVFVDGRPLDLKTYIENENMSVDEAIAAYEAAHGGAVPGTPAGTPTGANLQSDANAAYQNILTNLMEQGFQRANTDYQPNDYTTQINELYDQNYQLAKTQIENQLAQGMLDIDQAIAKLPGIYEAGMNDMAAQYDMNLRNANEYFAANGLTSGARAQAVLAMTNAYQSNMAAYRLEQANAIQEYEDKRADLKLQAQGEITEALLQNNMERAQALLSEYQRQDDQNFKFLLQKMDDDYRYYALESDRQIKLASLAEDIRQFDVNAALNREKLAEDQRQFDLTSEMNAAKLSEDARQFDETLALKNSTSSTPWAYNTDTPPEDTPDPELLASYQEDLAWLRQIPEENRKQYYTELEEKYAVIGKTSDQIKADLAVDTPVFGDRFYNAMNSMRLSGASVNDMVSDLFAQFPTYTEDQIRNEVMKSFSKEAGESEGKYGIDVQKYAKAAVASLGYNMDDRYSDVLNDFANKLASDYSTIGVSKAGARLALENAIKNMSNGG